MQTNTQYSLSQVHYFFAASITLNSSQRKFEGNIKYVLVIGCEDMSWITLLQGVVQRELL